MTRKALIEAARGDRPLDIVIRGGDAVNVYTGEIARADIGLFGERIAVVDWGGAWHLDAPEVIDARGLTAIPGFVDTHVHIESTMVTPPHFARAVLPCGTTTVVIDPHEIGNVTGRAGVAYMLRASAGLPLRVYVTVPSSVPAVPSIETAGAAFDAADVADMLTWPRVVGVAEMMDYPGIVRQEARAAAIAQKGLAAGKNLEGHAPLLAGRELAAYLAAGVDSEHEARSAAEMVDKARQGMWVYARENTFRHTAAMLADALTQIPLPWNIALCTDDIDPADLLRYGHMDRGVRVLLAAGVAPALAIRIATLNGAARYGLASDLGGIAPGKYADIVLIESLADLRAHVVLAGGTVVARDGALVTNFPDPAPPPVANTVRIATPLTADAFQPRYDGVDGDVSVPCIAMDIQRTTTLGDVMVRVVNGVIAAPLPDGVTLLSVVPRHGQAHPPSLALLTGLPLREGAIATTIAHDSHNLIVAGRTPGEMAVAAHAVAAMGGGVALAVGETVVATVRLPVAGLMSTEPVAEIAAAVRAFNDTARALGLGGASPVLAISSLALPVAPFVRITDRGVVDTLTQAFIPLPYGTRRD